MQVINLYKFQREDGGYTVSLTQPQCEYTPMYRLVADEGKVVTNGTATSEVIDTDTLEGWAEVDDEEEPTEEEYKEAFKIVTGEVNN